MRSRRCARCSSVAPIVAWRLSAAGLAAQQRGQGAGRRRLARRVQLAPTDFTGNWVAVITEDWRFRMVTPPKGDFASIPLNDAGQKLANAWDPAKDVAAGEQCRAYGAAGLMRMPIRLRVSWQDDTTLKLETDNGQQVRLFKFGDPPAPDRRPPTGRATPSRGGRRSRKVRARPPAAAVVAAAAGAEAQGRPAVERVAEGRDHADEARLPATQRHPLQRAGRADGVLRSHQRVQRRLVADRHVHGGGSGEPRAAVHDLHALQAGSRWVEVGARGRVK